MKVFSNKYLSYILVTLLIAGWFYWFQYRPSQIRQKCSERKIDYLNDELRENGSVTKYDKENADYRYEICINSNGLRN